MFFHRSVAAVQDVPVHEDATPADQSPSLREGLLRDERFALQRALPAHCEQLPQLESTFVIAAPPVRFPMFVSALSGTFQGSRRRRLRRLARAISTTQVEHHIIDHPDRPDVCLHRITVAP